MHVICSDAHHLHRPPFDLSESGAHLPAFEIPARIDSIRTHLDEQPWVEYAPAGAAAIAAAPAAILAVHDRAYVTFLRTAFAAWHLAVPAAEAGGDPSVLFPTVWPAHRSQNLPVWPGALAGFYATDAACPFLAGTWEAAQAAALCALTGADLLLGGNSAAFALCRPPGHHAGRNFAGGYCYLNNAAISARHLAVHAPVCILDIDYHAGNGTQDIFYADPSVLTVDIHADPAGEYPYFWGYGDERGEAEGCGFHHNVALPRGTGDEQYLAALAAALDVIRDFAPAYLVLSFGADICVGDPVGSFAVSERGIAAIGRAVAGLQLPTLIVLEGGYDVATLGRNVVNLLASFAQR
jgi:acetoin utilization deacetylase AcuC-like enzyme